MPLGEALLRVVAVFVEGVNNAVNFETGFPSNTNKLLHLSESWKDFYN